MRRDQ